MAEAPALIRLDHHKDQQGWDILSTASGPTCFDIGANVGQSTKLFAPNFVRVIAAEPCIESFRVLQAEAADNVVCANVAVSSHMGTVTLTETENSIQTGQLTTGTGLAWGERVGEREVPCVTIDHLIESWGVPSFVKIDTEGHEIEVLKGWTKPNCPVMVEVHRAENEELVKELLAGFNLTVLRHAPNVREYARLNHFWIYAVPSHV